MKISFLGKGSDTLLDDLESAGVELVRPQKHSGQVMNAIDWVEIVTSAKQIIPWAPIAGVFIAWLHGRTTRKIVLTSKDNSIIEIKGMSAAEIERILPACKSAIASEKKAGSGGVHK